MISFAVSVAFTSIALVKLNNEAILTSTMIPVTNSTATTTNHTRSLYPGIHSPSTQIPAVQPSRKENNNATAVADLIYNNSIYVSPLSWMAFISALLFYKGKIKMLWRKKGYDYDTFRLFTKMRGSSTRIKILQSLSLPKNKLQIANELGFDWRSIDNHIYILLQHDLIKEMISIGRTRYFIVTEKGKEILALLDDNGKGAGQLEK